MAEETKQNKVVFEREYIVPLREGWLKVPRYKRAKKAVKTLKEFMVRHMKVYDRDLRKIKVDIYLNNEIRFRGMKEPPAKIKVKAIKHEDGTVTVKLVQLPKHIEFELARKVRIEADKLKKEKTEKKPEQQEKHEESKEEKAEEAEKNKDMKEKEESSKLAEEKIEKTQAKQMQHTSQTHQQEPKIQRKTLKK